MCQYVAFLHSVFNHNAPTSVIACNRLLRWLMNDHVYSRGMVTQQLSESNRLRFSVNMANLWLHITVNWFLYHLL